MSASLTANKMDDDESADSLREAQASPAVKGFFDEPTNTISYIVRDPASEHAVIIDSVLDYDPNSARTSTESADQLLAFVREHGLQVDWILETHAHADHLSAAHYLKTQLGAPIAIGAQIRAVQRTFAKLFQLGDDFPVNGSQFDRLLYEGDRLQVGTLNISVMHTPGHTPACVTYLVGDTAFVGDTLFMPDYGTARADFPGGDAHSLYHSVQKIFALPPATRLFMCHDYMPGGREPQWETTVAEQRRSNTQIHEGVSEEAFVRLREQRDATLDMPRLILPAIQVNIRAGAMPPAEENGVVYLKLPLNVLR